MPSNGSKIMIESDCTQLVSMARNLARDRSEIRSVTEEAKGTRPSAHRVEDFQAKRDCNIASALAGLVRRSKHSVTWSEQTLACT